MEVPHISILVCNKFFNVSDDTGFYREHNHAAEHLETIRFDQRMAEWYCSQQDTYTKRHESISRIVIIRERGEGIQAKGEGEPSGAIEKCGCRVESQTCIKLRTVIIDDQYSRALDETSRAHGDESTLS